MLRAPRRRRPGRAGGHGETDKERAGKGTNPREKWWFSMDFTWFLDGFRWILDGFVWILCDFMVIEG